MVLPRLTLVLAVLPLLDGILADGHIEALCFDKACYTVDLGSNTFAEAREKCTNNGGDLVTIKSKEEFEQVKRLVLKLPDLADQTLKLWIGLQLKQCYIRHKLLKGFHWVTGDQDTEESQFSNWMQEPRSTCAQNRCVTMNLDAASHNNYKWLDGKCTSPANGYICKFHFKGMCKEVALAGPGIVSYNTPFYFMTTSLNLVPHASLAEVNCEQNDGKLPDFLICKERMENIFQWAYTGVNGSVVGPLCGSTELGCKHSNGGCEQECIEDPDTRSVRCGCKDGYVLSSDLVSCVLPQHCEPNPCQHSCTNLQHGFQCTCSPGFVLAENQLNCTDVDECRQNPCDQVCINTLGSFQCNCQEGFIVKGTDCIDIDECIDSTCTQGCLNTHGSYYCSCKEGYELGNDGFSCLDKDECINSPCAEKCLNTIGSYICFCSEGYLLSSDGISCNPDMQNENTHANVNPTGNQTISSIHGDDTYNPTIIPSYPNSVIDQSYTTMPEGSGVYLKPTPSMSPDAGSSLGNESVYHIQGGGSDSQKTLIIVSTLCACGVLLLLAVVVGIVCYRRRNTEKEEEYKPANAADNYCWVPEQSNRDVKNDYR
ncbi:complement component C1q receptor-like [Spea bombifrons]|uniref:complement component C1q receptor-like n=1 Tax=Spea bombifrons TaxID=233779 RepID=UPI00234B2DE4|nr:complement component C1q receptor-like [Spea bombifrons]